MAKMTIKQDHRPFPEAKTQIDFDLILASGCQNPKCKRKHRKLTRARMACVCGEPDRKETSFLVSYEKGGILEFYCSWCKALTFRVKVADP